MWLSDEEILQILHGFMAGGVAWLALKLFNML